jgi:glycosyltransferase involved in cell wall biosynthesis
VIFVSLAIAVAGAVVWTLTLRRVVGRAAGVEVATTIPPVSLIVPARDEAHNLPPLLASIAALDPAPSQVVIVDDHSTDGTGAIARAAGVDVVTPAPLPAGWIGKPWACQRGAEAATGELLLFSDADTVHATDSLARTVGRMERTGADLVSVVPTHVAVRPWERLQGVFHLLLLIATARGGFAIGQYLLLRRRTYDAIGGHAIARGVVAEDLLFLRRARHAELVLAPGLLRVRMYPEGALAFLRGWRRSFRAGFGDAGAVGFVEVTLVIGALGAPFVLLGAGHALAAGLGWLVVSAEIARRQRLVGELPAWGALLYPIALLAFIACTAAAVFDRLRGAPVRWRGRTYPRGAA